MTSSEKTITSPCVKCGERFDAPIGTGWRVCEPCAGDACRCPCCNVAVFGVINPCYRSRPAPFEPEPASDWARILRDIRINGSRVAAAVLEVGGPDAARYANHVRESAVRLGVEL